MSTAKKAAALFLIVAGLLVARYGFFFFRDNFTTHYPMKVLSATAFRAGEMPWWNFHDMGGQPLAGNPNALTFYPDNIFYLVFPAHVAFNLHFLVHLAAGFLAMRALCRVRNASDGTATVAALIWILSGVAISSLAFYNLVTTIALLPLALLAVEKRSGRLLGLSFGLLLLGSEPTTILGAALAVAIAGFGRMPWRSVAGAVVLAAAIGAPQMIAYSEIAGEVERSVPMSATAILATSLTPTRVAEIFFWPVEGFLNDAGGLRQRLFSTIFIGIIAIPALFRRSRYTLIAAAGVFFALGHNNPAVEWMVDALPPPLRLFRFPEKLALPVTAAIVVLIADFLARTRYRRLWAAVAIAPLLWTTLRALPIDWFAPYRVEQQEPVRLHWTPTIVPGRIDARAEYRQRAKRLDWLFGAVAGVRYAIGRSPDNMHSLLSRAVAERFRAAPPPLQARYLRANACNVAGAVPMAAIIPGVVPARSLGEAVRAFEDPRFDERRAAVAPASMAGFRSAAGRVERYAEDGQTIRVDVAAGGPVLLLVNQTFFEAWVARNGTEELRTVPLNIDRLGVIVPAGARQVTLAFGRRRLAVTATWLLSIAAMVGSALPRLIQKLDRRTGQVERAADEDDGHG